MFYSHILLTKKGPLAKVWLAAHWDGKITKAQVFETNLCQSVDAIIKPQVRLSLRTSGHLLLGVVKLHSRKARYLLSDCNETLIGIKMAFRPEAPIEELGACLPSAVTLPQIDLREAALLMEGNILIDLEVNYKDQMMFQARHEDITMAEEVVGNFSINDMNNDFGFGNEVPRCGEMMEEGMMDMTGVDNLESFEARSPWTSEDVVGDKSRQGGEESTRRNNAKRKCLLSPEKETTEAGMNFPYEFERDATIQGLNDVSMDVNDTTLFNIPMTPAPPTVEDVAMADVSQMDKPQDESVMAKTKDALVLQPIDAAYIGMIRKARRRRRLVVDNNMCLASETMRENFNNRADIIAELDLAPPTKVLMNWRVYTCEKMMEMPSRFMSSKTLLGAFKSGLNLTSGNKIEAREKKAAKAVSEILNEPLIITADDFESVIENSTLPTSSSDLSEIVRRSFAGANNVTGMSDIAGEPITTEQSLILDDFDEQLSTQMDRFTSSATKENRNKHLSLSAIDSFATPKRILRPSKGENLTPEGLKTSSRVRRFEEPLAKRLFTQGMATPKTPRHTTGDDSFVLPPPELQTPGGCETPRRNTAFDVTSTYSPIGTVMDAVQQEEAIIEREHVRKEDLIGELFEVIHVELRTVSCTFRDALKQLELKSGKMMTKRKAAFIFHALLELKKRGQIEVDQSTPFGAIRVIAIDC